jgi:hypothetical protein
MLMKLAHAWNSTEIKITIDNPEVISPSSSTIVHKAEYPSSLTGEFKVLLERYFQERWYRRRNLKYEFRNMETLGATIGQAIIITLIMGALFWQLKLDPGSVQNRTGFIFLIYVWNCYADNCGFPITSTDNQT